MRITLFSCHRAFFFFFFFLPSTNYRDLEIILSSGISYPGPHIGTQTQLMSLICDSILTHCIVFLTHYGFPLEPNQSPFNYNRSGDGKVVNKDNGKIKHMCGNFLLRNLLSPVRAGVLGT